MIDMRRLLKWNGKLTGSLRIPGAVSRHFSGYYGNIMIIAHSLKTFGAVMAASSTTRCHGSFDDLPFFQLRTGTEDCRVELFVFPGYTVLSVNCTDQAISLKRIAG
jgi:hypothetical protein